MAGFSVHSAAERGDIARVRALVEHDAAVVHMVDVNRRTPLMRASYLTYMTGGQQVEMARYLLNHGASVNHRDNFNSTSLHLACEWATGKMVALLLEKGADTTAVNHECKTPLMLAAHRNDPSMIELLLSHGDSDIDAVDASGYTALHYAFRYGPVASLKLLLEAGADPTIRTRSGRDAYGMADLLGADEVPKVLELQAGL